MPRLLAMFDQVRIINLVDRLDRRREVTAEINRIGGFDERVTFYPARRPTDPAGFPNAGARGCFESHLTALREAQAANVRTLLILEDDFDFVQDIETIGDRILKQLAATDWNFFYGSHQLEAQGREGLALVPHDEGVLTTAFVAIDRRAIDLLVDWLAALALRPPGSPDYGPMHVDGAYSVFRRLHPELKTRAAFPPLGYQRSSRSDITETGMFLDRFALTRPIASFLRRGKNMLKG
jgi:glycosyl transferase family 25